jgi:hypothetical protein
MAKRRLVVGGAGLRPVQRQPAVRVRDDFNAGAASGAGSDLAAIAQGLGKLAPKLQQFAGQLQEKKIEEGRAAGVARFAELIQEQADFASAMRQGLIEAKDSPFFRQGLMEAAGIVAADRYGDTLRTASGGIEDRSDIGRFDEVQAESYEAAVASFGDEGKSRAFNEAFNNRALGHTTSARSRFAAGQSSAMLEERGDLLYEETTSSIAVAIAEGADGAQMAEVLTRIADTAFGQGLTGSLVNAALTSAIVDTAVSLAETDPHAANRLLDAVEDREAGVRTGRVDDERRPLLADTKQAKAALTKARRDVRLITQDTYRFSRFREAEDLRIEADAVRSDALELYFEAEDVDDVNIEPLLQRAITIGDERLVGDLQAIRENMRSARWYTDQEKLASAQIAIWEPGSGFDMSNVSSMLARKEVTLADARSLAASVGSRDSMLAGTAADHPLNNLYFKQFTDADFTREFRDKFGFQGGQLGKLANLAMNGYRTDYLRAVEDGTFEAMTSQQKNDFLQELFRVHVDLRGGGRSTIESITQQGSLAPGAKIHDPTADWTVDLVLTRAEISRINEAERFSDLSFSDQELIWLLSTPAQWQEFKDSQNRLLLNLSEAQGEPEQE